jgi:hypothetical protein
VPKNHLGRTTFQLVEKCWQLFIAGRIEAFRFRTGLDFNLPDWWKLSQRGFLRKIGETSNLTNGVESMLQQACQASVVSHHTNDEYLCFWKNSARQCYSPFGKNNTLGWAFAWYRHSRSFANRNAHQSSHVLLRVRSNQVLWLLSRHWLSTLQLFPMGLWHPISPPPGTARQLVSYPPRIKILLLPLKKSWKTKRY